MSVILATGRRRKGKSLEVPFKYIFYRGSTAEDPTFNQDPTFIFAIMLFHLATKRDQVIIRNQP